MFLFAPIRWAFKITGLLITAAAIYLLVTGVQVVLAENSIGMSSATNQRVNAIIVLVPEQSSAVATPDLVARLQETQLLIQRQVSNHVILVSTQRSGLTTPLQSSGSPSSNDALNSARRWLIAHGISRADVVGTYRGATYSALLSAARSLPALSHVVIVTDAIDRLWVAHMTKAVGLSVESIDAAVGSQRLFTRDFRTLWVQDSGVAVGRIIGFSHTTWLTG